MFCSARWKAYLRSLQSIDKDNAAGDDTNSTDEVIYHIYHSQMIWFAIDEANDYNEVADDNLKRCDVLLQDCSTMVNALEEKLANTPKPSEVLDWW